MIDCEIVVFNAVASRLREEYTGIFVAGEYVDAPSHFPAVTLVEISNSVYEPFRTANAIENAAIVTFEVNVYSNKQNGRKTEAKTILQSIDGTFAEMGFTRTFKNQVPNINDATIFRLVARYEAIIVPNDNGFYYVHTN